ncbi:MAG TPA: hypothetical protein VGQ41_13740 [Pyrinomonadaceae bacterium]|jgi:hypothetical protein|nr:hypothetical protein [Pyrinomonadaceae bacterium]
MTTNCRNWLRANNYDDVVDLIDKAMNQMAVRGSKQRRNWWGTLAGGANGRPSVVEGIEFPVLRCAQRHERKPITPNAICRNPDEKPPEPRFTNRWPNRKKKRRLRSNQQTSRNGNVQQQ